MNLKNYIKSKMSFLKKNNFTYSKHTNENVYWDYVFEKDDCRIILSQDYRDEFLDLKIKCKTTILLETSYANIVINDIFDNREKFEFLLNTIYSDKKDEYSLSKKQFKRLIDFYAEFVKTYLKEIIHYERAK